MYAGKVYCRKATGSQSVRLKIWFDSGGLFLYDLAVLNFYTKMKPMELPWLPCSSPCPHLPVTCCFSYPCLLPCCPQSLFCAHGLKVRNNQFSVFFFLARIMVVSSEIHCFLQSLSTGASLRTLYILDKLKKNILIAWLCLSFWCRTMQANWQKWTTTICTLDWAFIQVRMYLLKSLFAKYRVHWTSLNSRM